MYSQRVDVPSGISEALMKIEVNNHPKHTLHKINQVFTHYVNFE